MQSANGTREIRVRRECKQDGAGKKLAIRMATPVMVAY
jgi:hypothetical protein